jgi:tryptophan synthase alpha chain
MTLAGNRIDSLFESAKRSGRTAFIPFVTAGDPNLATTMALIEGMVAEAARVHVPLLVEIGFPYTDPIADGPAIQESYNRALGAGVRVSAIFDAVRALRKTNDVPLVAMVSQSIVQRTGIDRFVTEARSAGFDGLIVPDLPFEEAAELGRAAQDVGLRVIQLVAPTSPPERARSLAAAASGFVYCVSVVGITGGTSAGVPVGLDERVASLRSASSTPVCVGFGISAPEHVAALKGVADGVIVGSAIVRKLASVKPGDAASLAPVIGFVGDLMKPLAG